MGLAAGWNHGLAALKNGRITSWGANYAGQVPVPLAATNVAAVAAGTAHSLALLANGTIIAWGSCCAPEAGLSTITNGVAISAYSGANLVLREDGTLFSTRGNFVPNASNLVATATSLHYDVALKPDGTVLAWAQNGPFQVPEAATNVIAVASGNDHTLVLREDGSVFSWGGDERLAKIPAGVSNIVSIAAGYYVNLALRNDGVVFAWGDEYSGAAPAPANATNAATIGGAFFSMAAPATGGPASLARVRKYHYHENAPILLTSQVIGQQPLKYQWLQNGVPIAGETNSWLKRGQAQYADAGAYSIIASNTVGSQTSLVARVQVSPAPPTASLSKTDWRIIIGGNATINAAVAGTQPLAMQWQFNGTNIVGATTDVLTLNNLQPSQAGEYRLVVSNLVGWATSQVARVRVDLFELNFQQQTNFIGDTKWVDFNSDGLLDFISGPRLYRNIGGGAFQDDLPSFVSVAQSYWADFDNDGYMDVALTRNWNVTLHHNQKDGTFTNIASFSVPGDPYLDWGDFDNDGLVDFIAGGDIYRNNGSLKFSRSPSSLPVSGGIPMCGDYDNDGWLDILISKVSSLSVCQVYRNLGNGSFSNINLGLPAAYMGEASWVDYDSDGRLDIFFLGTDIYGENPVSGIYKNGGGNVFIDIGTRFLGLRSPKIAWGDYDNDGAVDLFTSGTTNVLYRILNAFYHNERENGFRRIDIGLPDGIQVSRGAWGDGNNDGLLDFLTFQFNSPMNSINPSVSLYSNRLLNQNQLPESPNPLDAFPQPNGIMFRWSQAQDQETPSPTLTYNVRVGSSPGASDIVSPMSLPDGHRLLPKGGNTGFNLHFLLEKLKFGTYYWGVQSIDSSYGASAFSPEQVLTYSVRTMTATNVSAEAAILRGALTASGLPTAAYFEWWREGLEASQTSVQAVDSGETNRTITAGLSGLQPGVSYSYRIVTSNALQATTGNVVSFTTPRTPTAFSVHKPATKAATLQFEGSSGSLYDVLFSTNLTQWSLLDKAIDTGTNVYLFSDPGATNSPARFYRIKAR